jgi:phosphohistidine phosphatase SixA
LLRTISIGDIASNKKQNLKWAERLRGGGFILFFRHANRESWPLVSTFDVYALAANLKDPSQASFKRAVCLSEQGIEEAKIIGRILQLAKIPTGTVISSPSCRAMETAMYAFGKIDRVDNSLLHSALVSDKVLPSFLDQLRTLLLNVDIKAGTNTVITSHNGTLDRNKGLPIEGQMELLDETGFYIIERKANDKLAVVYTMKSINDVATSALDLPLR